MMETKVWPTLYSKGSKGEIRIWDISVEGNNVTISHGVKGGKIVTKVTQSFGKNRGKKNETSDHTQALADAQSKFDKQLKRGYYPTEKEAIESIDMTPMKLQNFADHEKKVEYPCYIQTKLDGLRMLVDKGMKPQSKAGEDYVIPGHILDDLLKLKGALKDRWYGLDGEIYAGHKDRGGLSLQEIVSAFRKENVNTPKLQYWVYDIPKAGEYFSTRNERLEELQYFVKEMGLKNIVILPSRIVVSKAQIDAAFKEAVQNNEEGLVIRNQRGYYEFGKRSYDAQKLKHRSTTEAYVFGATQDKNGESVLTASLKNNTMFKVKMRKDAHPEINLRLWENREHVLDKFIEVEYENLSDSGVPAKPVGLRIREVNPETWEPKE